MGKTQMRIAEFSFYDVVQRGAIAKFDILVIKEFNNRYSLQYINPL